MMLTLLISKYKGHEPFALQTLKDFDMPVSDDKLHYKSVIANVVKVTCNQWQNTFTIYCKRGDIISLYSGEIFDYRIEV